MSNKVIKIDDDFRTGAGCAATISWQRMEEVLRKAGELKSHERISGYHLDDHGLQYYVKRVNES